jgi:polyisoprenoid-binding protein YceI
MMSFCKLVVRVRHVVLLIVAMAPAYAADWVIDTSKSKLAFSGTQTGSRFDGQFSRYNAAIVFDSDHLDTSHLTVTVDLVSAKTGDPQRDTALPGKDWLDISEFPQARFESNAIRKILDGAYEATGTLTIRGVSRQMVLPFTLEFKDAIAHAKGHLDLIRSSFGIGQGPWSTGQWVALEVGVEFDIVATKTN